MLSKETKEALDAQQKAGKQLEELLAKYKKMAYERRTEAKIADTESEAQRIWSEFQERDARLQGSGEVTSLQYTTENYLEYVREFLEALLSKLARDRLRIQPLAVGEENAARNVALARLKGFLGAHSSLDDELSESDGRALAERLSGYLMVLKVSDTSSLDEVALANYESLISVGESLLDQLRQRWPTPGPSGSGANPLVSPQSPVHSPLNSSHRGSSATTPRPPKINLPHLQIPMFDGNFKEWINFKELFESLIGSNPELLPAHKMSYLKSHLSGPALEVVRHLQLGGDSFQSAWYLLNRRYNNRKALLNDLFRWLLGLNKLIKFN